MIFWPSYLHFPCKRFQVCSTKLSLCPVRHQNQDHSKHCANWVTFQVQEFCVFIAQFLCLQFSLTVFIISPFLSLFQGTLSILEEENHIKDVLSRIVVEMIKREWPQHWPDMLMELDTLSRQGVRSAFLLPAWSICVLVVVRTDVRVCFVVVFTVYQ